jgi:hypothetical protein
MSDDIVEETVAVLLKQRENASIRLQQSKQIYNDAAQKVELYEQVLKDLDAAINQFKPKRASW